MYIYIYIYTSPPEKAFLQLLEVPPVMPGHPSYKTIRRSVEPNIFIQCNNNVILYTK